MKFASWVVLGVVAGGAVAAGCGSSSKSSAQGDLAFGTGTTGVSATSGGSGDVSSGVGPGTSGATTGSSMAVGTTASTTSGAGGAVPAPGQLTAGVWDDNRNWDFFGKYLANHAQDPGLVPFTSAERASAHTASLALPAPRDVLDIAIVLDTTGSMGDELTYLKSEVGAISKTIAANFPNADQRWGLVAYKDEGDVYVTKSFEFATIGAFQTSLGGLTAGGGGDIPEAPEQGLAAGAKLAWRGGNTARLMFWIGDASHHLGHEGALADAVHAAQKLGVHIYPIAASGADTLLEHTMRSSAQLTGGRYMFLTDDSGIGDPHKEPEIPCYFVTKLNKAIERMVDIEMSGMYHEPPASDILRTGGDPQKGKCTVGSDVFIVF
jgi:hypothetical protein